MLNNDTPHILICRLSAIGDCILTLPVLCALRAQFPEARLVWVAEPAGAILLSGHRCLDELIVIPKGILKSPHRWPSLRAQLRHQKFDVALDAQGLTKSAFIAWLSGAPQRIGFAAPRGREFSRWLNRQLIKPTTEHIIDAHLQLLRPLGISAPAVEFQLPVSVVSEARVDELLAKLHLGCDFVLINSGAGWDSRLWPPQRFGKVAKLLGQRYQLPSLVVWAGPRERAWAETIVGNSGGHAVVAPETNLPELVSISRRARLFLGSDTGPLHIAGAVGTPCVSLHGTTRAEASGAYGARGFAIQYRYQAGTNRQRRLAGNDAMREIPVEPVIAACEQLLFGKSSNKPRRLAA